MKYVVHTWYKPPVYVYYICICYIMLYTNIYNLIELTMTNVEVVGGESTQNCGTAFPSTIKPHVNALDVVMISSCILGQCDIFHVFRKFIDPQESPGGSADTTWNDA